MCRDVSDVGRNVLSQPPTESTHGRPERPHSGECEALGECPGDPETRGRQSCFASLQGQEALRGRRARDRRSLAGDCGHSRAGVLSGLEGVPGPGRPLESGLGSCAGWTRSVRLMGGGCDRRAREVSALPRASQGLVNCRGADGARDLQRHRLRRARRAIALSGPAPTNTAPGSTYGTAFTIPARSICSWDAPRS